MQDIDRIQKPHRIYGAVGRPIAGRDDFKQRPAAEALERFNGTDIPRRAALRRGPAQYRVVWTSERLSGLFRDDPIHLTGFGTPSIIQLYVYLNEAQGFLPAVHSAVPPRQ